MSCFKFSGPNYLSVSVSVTLICKVCRELWVKGFNKSIYQSMSTRNIKIIVFLGSKVRLVRRADNLSAIYEPIV
jgi:hypothetical protein